MRGMVVKELCITITTLIVGYFTRIPLLLRRRDKQQSGRLLLQQPSNATQANQASAGSAAAPVADSSAPAQAKPPATGAAASAAPAAAAAGPSSPTSRQKPPSQSTPAAAAGTAAPVKDSIRSRLEPGFRIANGGRCPERGRDLRLVILITTAPGHQRQRKAIRLTWGGSVAQRRDVTLLFFLGRAAEPHQSAVDEEQQTYGDIVQGNFVDAYNNLTLKSAVMLEWLDTFCPEARMILKTDDDMFINTDNLLKFVDVHSKDTNKLFGRLARRWKPNRSVKSKYYLSPESFAGKYLPDFVTGPAYVMTGDLVKPLYQATLDAKFLTLEDVLVTGVVADKLHIKRVHAKEFINDRIKADTCKFATSVSVHMVKFEEQFDIWKRIQDGRTRCPQYVPTGG
ncbi:beta-1,3-galactosyltransferase 5-like isoform X2 [Amphibalanus amphitrite]|uniref:beta-1,3-galactosyltransferase 5-like isoform X2 n=1 Tax=Amphibalanus amphitrite TaxID=1232801 RepID=UPI001C928119|nr:beta-1,3-galactosyltransferase 5-like isoform X2 [Amphibalanus amphitrite]